MTAVSMPMSRRRHRNNTMAAMPCQYAQHGPTVAKRCFAKLLVHKLTVARQSPYDVTALVDGDLVANPLWQGLELPARQASFERMVRQTLSLFGLGRSKDADVSYPYDVKWSNDTLGQVPLVSALVFYRKVGKVVVS
eukprot:1365678-Prymnesium_polylepis.1